MVFLGKGSPSHVLECGRAECLPCHGAGAVGQGPAPERPRVCRVWVHVWGCTFVCVRVRGVVPAAGVRLQLGKLLCTGASDLGYQGQLLGSLSVFKSSYWRDPYRMYVCICIYFPLTDLNPDQPVGGTGRDLWCVHVCVSMSAHVALCRWPCIHVYVLHSVYACACWQYTLSSGTLGAGNTRSAPLLVGGRSMKLW